MPNNIIKEKALERIQDIHKLSSLYNEKVGKEHQERLLELMRKHIDEIEELFASKDKHALVETGDLIILCFEILLEHGASIDEIVEKCFGRYERKLGELLEDR